MRGKTAVIALILAAGLAPGGSGIVAAAVTAAADSGSAAAPDSVKPGIAVGESLRVVRIVRPDTAEVVGPAVPRFHDPSRIDFEAQRKRGDVTLEAALQARRAALIAPLPLSGTPTGTLVEPGSGVRWSPGSDRPPGEGGTDRAWIVAAPYGTGFFDSHTSIVDPASDGHDVLDWIAIESSLEPSSLRRGDALLTGPEPTSSLASAMPGQPVSSRRPRSALYYSNGEMGELVTGARFASPALGRGIGAAYSRHEADGVTPLSASVASRYAGAVGLPGALGHSFWVDGWIFARTIEDEALQSDASTVLGRSEANTRTISLHGRAVGKRATSLWTVRGARAKRTRVEPNGPRERWEFPEWSLAWTGDWKADSAWTAVAAVDVAARRVEYTDVTGSGFSERKDQARLAFGARRASSDGSGFAADAAWDVRDSDDPLWNARVSVWKGGARASGRIDLESAHERPTWVDRLTPARTVTAPRLPDFAKTLRLTRSGDAALQARRLSGAAAQGAVELSRVFSLSGSAALRRVTNDFGWDLTRAESADSLLVEVTARQRGDGWTSYASLGFSARAGTASLRGLGWARKDAEALTPRAGSPSSWGVEGAFDIGITLFRGDLPLVFGIEAHVAGKRDGPITDDAGATFDAAFRADFGNAGAFVEWLNLFDRPYRSALYDLSEDRGVPMPQRALRFGLVWYLLD